MRQPDNLQNALIKMLNGGGLRRVIRDDGDNGLWIANPNNPASMKYISREEYQQHWELEKSGDAQGTRDLSDVKWGRMGQPTEQVVMNRMEKINTPKIEVTPVEARKNEGFDGGRSVETDREAMKQEILGEPVLDATFSGEPVGGNEEPISTFEEDRAASEADAEAAEAREEDLSGQFQEFEAQDMGDEGTMAEETPEAPVEEPTAGNEDPATAEEMEAEAGSNPNASDAAGATKAEKDAAKAAKKAERDAAKAARKG